MGMMELVHNNPQMWQTHGDLIAEAQDWPNADKFAQRSRLSLPPPVQQAIMSENSGNPEVEAVKQQAQQMVGQLHQQIQGAEQGIQQRDQEMQKLTQELQAAKTANDSAMLKAHTDQFNAETARMKMMHDAQNAPKDTAGLEHLRLQYEDLWKKLDAATKVIVAEVGAKSAVDTALLAAESAANQTEIAGLGANQ